MPQIASETAFLASTLAGPYPRRMLQVPSMPQLASKTALHGPELALSACSNYHQCLKLPPKLLSMSLNLS